MATNVSDYGRDFWIGVLFGTETAPSGYWIALCIDTPDEGFDGTILADIEPDGFAYARVFVAAGDTNWAAGSGAITNLLAVTYPTPTGEWGLVSHFALCNDDVDGEIYAFGEFDDSQVVDADNPAVIPIGGITMTISGPVSSIAS